MSDRVVAILKDKLHGFTVRLRKADLLALEASFKTDEVPEEVVELALENSRLKASKTLPTDQVEYQLRGWSEEWPEDSDPMKFDGFAAGGWTALEEPVLSFYLQQQFAPEDGGNAARFAVIYDGHSVAFVSEDKQCLLVYISSIVNYHTLPDQYDTDSDEMLYPSDGDSGED